MAKRSLLSRSPSYKYFKLLPLF